MVKTFTAEEFFNYLMSFSNIFIWGGGDEDNGLYVRIRSQNLELIKRKKSYAIWGTLYNVNPELQEEAGFVITGNKFQCEIFENGRKTEVITKSDLSKEFIRLELLKGRFE